MGDWHSLRVAEAAGAAGEGNVRGGSFPYRQGRVKSSALWRYLSRAPRLLPDILVLGRYGFSFDLMPLRAEGMSVGKRLNLLVAGLNLLHRRLVPWSWPIHLQVEVVNYCNLRCPVCPVGTGALERQRMAMDLELYERLMAEVGRYLLTVPLWAWGEPLLHPRLAEMVGIARKHGVIPMVSTNGQNLDDRRVVEDLAREPPTYLIVAIDGVTRRTASLNRPGADIEAALRGVRRLADIKRRTGQQLPVLHLRTIVTRHNQDEVGEVKEFAAANGFDFMSLRALVVIGGDESAHRQRVPDVHRFRAYDYEGDARVRRRDFLCERAFCFPAVLADGTVVACDQDYNARHPLGRLGMDGTFADIWFGPKAREVRRTIRQNRESFSFCRDCPFADRPTGTCSISAYDLRGEPRRADLAATPIDQSGERTLSNGRP